MSRSSILSVPDTFSLCRAILIDTIASSVAESESAQFYRLQIEKCQQYIKNVQLQATRTWESPSKPQELSTLEDQDFFISGPPLRLKLALIQDEKKVQESKRVSLYTRNNSIRASVRSRNSYAWSEQKYKELKGKADFRKANRQASLQKLAVSRKVMESSPSEKQLRAALIDGKSKLQLQNGKHQRVVLRRKEKIENEEGSTIPMLVELTYNITGADSKHQKSLQKRKEQMKLKTEKEKQRKTVNRLKINSYSPSINQIKVNNWRQFNEIIGQSDLSNRPMQFENIHYYTEK